MALQISKKLLDLLVKGFGNCSCGWIGRHFLIG